MKNIDASYIIIIFQSFLTSDFLTPVNIFIRIYAKKTFFFFSKFQLVRENYIPIVSNDKSIERANIIDKFLFLWFFFFLFIYFHTTKSRNKIGRRILSNFFYFSNNFERNRLIKFDFAIMDYILNP